MSRVAITRQKLDELALHVSAKSGEAMPLTIDGMMDAVDDIHLDDKFIVTIYYTTDSKWNEVPYIPDCTYTELEAAYASGKEIAFRLDQNRKGPVISAYADGYTELYDGRVSAWYSVYVAKYDPESYDGRNNADYSISGSSIQFWWTWSYNDEDGYVGYFGRSTNIRPYGTFGVTNTNIGTGTVILPSYRQCSITMLTLPTSTSTIRGGSNILTIPASTSVRYLNIDSGFNKTQGSYTLSAMPSGTAGTPTATKGTVSNHSITVTPKVTNTTGYITGSTKTGTAVTVTASELESGTKSITANGTGIDVTGYAAVDIAVPSSTPTLQAKTNIAPTTSSQTITADTGYDGLSSVQINAIPSGTAGTPSAAKGTVSNHSVSVTPSVTNTTGYITGGTKTGTAVTVNASELVSGSETKTANGTYDVTNLAELVVNVSGGGGASNYVHGEFTANSTAGIQTVSIPYTGSGYPIMAYVVIKGGAYKSGTDWYNLVQRYAVGMWCMSKSNMSTAPNWTSATVTANQAVTAAIYKNNATGANIYSRTSAMSTSVYGTENPSANAIKCVHINSATSMKVYVNTSSYGLVPGMDYEYFIVYSS